MAKLSVPLNQDIHYRKEKKSQHHRIPFFSSTCRSGQNKLVNIEVTHFFFSMLKFVNLKIEKKERKKEWV